MLTWNVVLTYVKGRLALPSSFIEHSDTAIIDWCKLTALKDYSRYYPDVERTSVLVTSPEYQHEFRNGWYYFFDDENLEIIGIKDCYFPAGDSLMTGHPAWGVWSFDQMKWWSIDVFKSRFFSSATYFHKTFKFHPPNIVEVLGMENTTNTTGENFVVEYERIQPLDLRRLPPAMHRIFMDLCLAECMLWLGSVRSHYGDGRLSTPYGEIPLNGEALKNEGMELKRDLLERMERDSLPPIIVDIG